MSVCRNTLGQIVLSVYILESKKNSNRKTNNYILSREYAHDSILRGISE